MTAFFIKKRTPVGPQVQIFHGDGKYWPEDLRPAPKGCRIYCYELTDKEAANASLSDLEKKYNALHASGASQ